MSAIAGSTLHQAAEFSRALTASLPGSGFLIVDADLCVVHAEGDAHRELDRGAVIGRHVREVIPALAWEILRSHYAAALSGTARRFEYEATDRSTHSLLFVPIGGPDGRANVVVLSEDTSAQTAVRRRLAESERLQASVLDVLDEGILVVDRGRELVRANSAASQILGVDLSSVDGAGEWWAPFAARRRDRPGALDVGRHVMETGEGVKDVPVMIDRPDGTRAELAVNYLPLRADDGSISGLVLSFRDVTGHEQGRRELAAARELLQGTLDSLTAHIALLDASGEILLTNRAWIEFGSANGARHDAAGGNYLTVCDRAGDDPAAMAAAAGIREILAGGRENFTLEYPCHSPTDERWFLMRASRYDGDGPPRVVVAHADITQRRRAELEVSRQAALLDEVDVSVVVSDPQQLVTHWNRGAEQLYGWRRAEALGRPLPALHAAVEPEQQTAIAEALAQDGRWEGEAIMARRDGTVFPADVRDRLMFDDDGRPLGTISVAVDVSEREAAKRRLVRTRNYLRAVADSMGEGLFTLDLDGCVIYVNRAAEQLLGWTASECAGRPVHELIYADTDPSAPDAALDASPILRAHRDGLSVRIEEDVFLRADGRAIQVAYTASPFRTDDGIEGYVVVFADVTERKRHEQDLEMEIERLSWIERIQATITEDRLLLYAQPIVDLHTRQVAQRELLLRVRQPDGEITGPAELLQAAEEFRLTGDIDRWVITRAVELAALGHNIGVNVSAHSVGDPLMLGYIEQAIARSGADPRRLSFEITETAMVGDGAAAFRFAERLHGLGCRLALDDFGTGYGGFTYLKKLPVDYLKIDTEFVVDLLSNPGSQEVVQAVVALARGFGLQTVAEGVEDAETLDRLIELGVDFAQGFHLARPGPLPPGVAPPAQPLPGGWSADYHAASAAPESKINSSACGPVDGEEQAMGQPGDRDLPQGDEGADREQVLADLDQSIADREQALADRDQIDLDRAQASLDLDVSSIASELSHRLTVHQRQRELDRHQARADARQEQLDSAQTAGDARQELIDVQRDPLSAPAHELPSDEQLRIEALARAAATLTRAGRARQRAEQALARAQAAEARARELSGRVSPDPPSAA